MLKNQVSSLIENPKYNGKNYVGEGVFYKIKGNFRYGGNIISNPQSEITKSDNYKQLQMGIIGEPIIGESIIGSTAKMEEMRNEGKAKNQRMKSLDSKISRFKDEGYKELADSIIPLSNKNIKLPVLANQNYPPGLAVYDSQSKLKQNMKYRLKSGNRYKNLTNQYSIIHKNYVGKDNKSQKASAKAKLHSVNKLERQSKAGGKSKVYLI